MAQSVRRHFTGKIYLLVVDSDEPELIPDGMTQVRRSQVIEPHLWWHMEKRYNVLELCCALKSFLMRFVAQIENSPIIYLDADTYLLKPIDACLPTRSDFSVFLRRT